MLQVCDTMSMVGHVASLAQISDMNCLFTVRDQHIFQVSLCRCTAPLDVRDTGM